MRLSIFVSVLALVATTCVVPSRTVRHEATEPLPAASHDPDREGALIGAVVGAATGAMIGYFSSRSSGFGTLGAILGAVPGLLAGMVVGAAIDASDAFEPAAGHEPTVTYPDTTAAPPDFVP